MGSDGRERRFYAQRGGHVFYIYAILINVRGVVYAV